MEIRFSEDDEREYSAGALFLDMPNEPMLYPSYALFLDPGNALILRPRHGPVIAPGEDCAPEGDADIGFIVTSEDVRRLVKTRRRPENCVRQTVADNVRIGVASFVRQFKPEAEGKTEDKAEDHGNQMDPVMLVEMAEKVYLNESWGSISREDPRVQVTII